MAFNSMRTKNEGGVYRNTGSGKRILISFEAGLVRLRAIGDAYISDTPVPQRDQVFNGQFRPMDVIYRHKMHILPWLLFINDNQRNLAAVEEPGRAIK